jgi:F0F1-type ATP synthase assembly protein I
MQSKRVPKIFINYRNDDAAESASLLHETLTRKFGHSHIFWDARTIEGGAIFDQSIQEALLSSGVLLAVIGKDWLTVSREGKRRLDDADDYVCLEIATALRQGIRVIPVLVDGATLPRAGDLPLAIKKLVKRHGMRVSRRSWQEDTRNLTRSIEKDFQKTSPYSLLFGAIAGLLAGTVFGIVYTLQQQKVPKWRFLVIGLLGLFAGLILSSFINYGITRCSKLLRWSSLASPIGGTLGGALGGALASLLFALAFIWVEHGDPVNPLGVTAAVAASTVFIAAGILLPEWKKEWYKRLITLLAVVLGTLIAAVLAVWLLHEKLGDLQDMLMVANPFSKGVVIIGLVCGGMSGLQVGLTLWAYDRMPGVEDLKL